VERRRRQTPESICDKKHIKSHLSAIPPSILAFNIPTSSVIFNYSEDALIIGVFEIGDFYSVVVVARADIGKLNL
jgi:hypothetical protein